MKMLKKRWFAGICVFLFSAVFMSAAFVQEAKAESYVNEDTNYRIIIEDDADLLDDEEEILLLDDMKDITQYGNVAFKSIDHNSSSAKNYAENYYYNNFGNSSGIVFLIDMDNRRIQIAADGAIYKVVTPAKANTITDNIYRYASAKNYYLCAKNAFSQIKALLEGGRIAEPMKHVSNAILSLIIAMLVFFLFIIASARTKRAGTNALVSGTKKAVVEGSEAEFRFVNETKKYSPVQRSGGGGHGGFGGGGGGGFSGGGGGHGF